MFVVVWFGSVVGFFLGESVILLQLLFLFAVVKKKKIKSGREKKGLNFGGKKGILVGKIKNSGN